MPPSTKFVVSGDDITPTSICVSSRGGKTEGQVLYRTLGQDEQPQLDVSGNVENLAPGQVVGVGQLFESYDVAFSFTVTASAKDVRTTQSTTHQSPKSYSGYEMRDGKIVQVDRDGNPIANPTPLDRKQGGGDGLRADA